MPVSESQISELEIFFENAKIPARLQFDAGTKIDDVSKFIKSHLHVFRNNREKPIFEVFYSRLLKLKEIIEKA